MQIIMCCCGGFAVACAACVGSKKMPMDSGPATTIIVTGAPTVQGNPLAPASAPIMAGGPPPPCQPPPPRHSPPTWTRKGDGKDTWFVSSAGETVWTLPAGAVCNN